MKPKNTFRLLSLVACLVVSCTCSLLGPRLSESIRLGRNATINYPEDWYALREYDAVFISPEYIDVDDIEGDRYFYEAIFIGFSLDEWYGSDWYTEYRSPEEMLEELEYEFETGLHSFETFDVGDIEWTRASFRGTFLTFDGYWEGWVAVEMSSRSGIVIAVAAPEDEWDDYGNTFEAMLKRIEFAD